MMAGIFGFITVMLVFQHYAEDLPDFDQLADYDPPITTRLYAADGKLLAEYARERRIFLPLHAIPKRVTNAFIAAEDRNFYTHQGVDIVGIGRAVVKNVNNIGTGRSLVGGSTITQQVVKNFLLTSEKSFERKIKEAILAYRISKVYSKDKILELYLNDIYLGLGSYGVASAALNYFNKSLDELNVEEAALLAAMPKAPSRLNPIANYERAEERRNYVIDRMYEDGMITREEADRARSMPIVLQSRDETDVAEADFFAEEVRRKLADMYGSSVLYEGGLTVKTTLQPDIQRVADEALRNALLDYDRRHGYRGPVTRMPVVANWKNDLPKVVEEHSPTLFGDETVAVVLQVKDDLVQIGTLDGNMGTIGLDQLKWARAYLSPTSMGPAISSAKEVLEQGDVILVRPLDEGKNDFALHQIPKVNGAVVAMDPHTGRVLAMSGGYAYGKTEFNRATQARRQPGSAFKPFAYMAALEAGFTPSTVIMDGPVEISQGPGLPVWTPQNYDGKFMGPTTLRVGLEKSRNAMTVRLAQLIGISRILHVARRYGIYDEIPRNYSVVLGSHETTLLKLTNAYAMLVNGGKKLEPALIERIDDRNGSIIYRRDTRDCEGCLLTGASSLGDVTPPILHDDREIVADARIAYQVVSMLEGVVQRGTGVRARKVGKPLAGKTGTTNDSRDTWFMGFSPDLVMGVYIGFDQPASLGDKETGSRVALPAFVEFMDSALADTPARPFRIPPGIRQIRVDRSTGLPPNPAIPTDGEPITESFVVGGNIFIPRLPGDPEPSAQDTQTAAPELPQLEFEDGFSPYSTYDPRTQALQDGTQMMSPDELQRQFQQGQEVRQPPQENPFEMRNRRAPRRGFSTEGTIDYGTGGLY